MKWELLTLGLGWGVLLFKLYQQYRQCRKTYHNQHIYEEQPPKKTENILFDSENKPIPNQPPNQVSMPNQAAQVQKIEGKSEIQQPSQQKLQHPLKTTIEQSDFVVFPQLYPHLRKKKNLIRKITLGKTLNQRHRLITKRKRDTKKQIQPYSRYKDWFITNKVLSQIQQSGQLTPQQIQQNYATITKEIKSNLILTQKSHSESSKSEQGTEIPNGQIIITKNPEKKNNKNDQILGFLEQEDPFEANSLKILKYDPFE